MQRGRGIDNPCNFEEDKDLLAELLFHCEKENGFLKDFMQKAPLKGEPNLLFSAVPRIKDAEEVKGHGPIRFVRGLYRFLAEISMNWLKKIII